MMMEKNKLSVLIVNGLPEIRDHVAQALRMDREETSCVESNDDAARIVETKPFDVIVVGTSMPDGAGTDLVESCKRLHGRAPLLMVIHDEGAPGSEPVATSKITRTAVHDVNNSLAVIQGRAGLLRKHATGEVMDPAFIAISGEKVEVHAKRIAAIMRELRKDAT